jgi:acetyl-CoA acetyltransferase
VSAVEIAIVGAGIYPFGRHEGVTGMAMGVHAARDALADAGVAWDDVQFAYGGSEDAGNADTMVADLGPTGVPFINVKNGCATGGSSLVSRSRRCSPARTRSASSSDSTSTSAAHFQNDPADWSLPAWYGEIGLMVTTQFFGAKLQRYMHDYAIPTDTLAQVAEKAFANGSITPHAWRRRALSADEILTSQMLADPLTQYMLCSPGEGGAALVVCRREYLSRLPEARPIWLRSVSLRTRRAGSFEVFSPSLGLEIADSPTVDASRAVFEAAGVGPTRRRRRAGTGHGVGSGADPSRRMRPVRARRTDRVVRARSHAHRRRPAGEHGRRLPRQRRAGGRVRPAPGLRGGDAATRRGGRAPGSGEPTVGFTQVYGAPGVSACTVVSR